jgi:hypothetical protein
VKILAFSSAIAFLAASSLVNGAVISTPLGNTSPGFADGSHPFSATVLTNLTGLAPFNAICGSDTGPNGSTNCSTTWTFHYSIPSGDTIIAATLTLGIWDIDSATAPNQSPSLQVNSYSLAGGDLTALLNTVSEALNGGSGATNNEYDVLTVNIPSTSFGDLMSGSAIASLALKAPGLGALGNSPSNGAGLVFSRLDITAAEPTPEPSFMTLVPMALGAFAFYRRRRKSC